MMIRMTATISAIWISAPMLLKKINPAAIKPIG